MINHARTLLLNVDGAKAPGADYYLEEYVPADFQAFTPPGWLQTLRTVLFGGQPDRTFLNFRLQQYMLTAHSTEYGAYVTALDPRVTYLPDPAAPGPEAIGVPTTPVITPLCGAPADDVTCIGALNSLAETPRMKETWEITVIGPAAVRLRKYIDGTSAEAVPSFSSGWSLPIDLPGVKGVSVRLRDPLPPEGAGWTVEIWRAPEADLLEVVSALSRMSDAVYAELFPIRAPYDVFRQLWEREAFPLRRLTGVILAAAYRTEELRNGG